MSEVKSSPAGAKSLWCRRRFQTSRVGGEGREVWWHEPLDRRRRRIRTLQTPKLNLHDRVPPGASAERQVSPRGNICYPEPITATGGGGTRPRPLVPGEGSCRDQRSAATGGNEQPRTGRTAATRRILRQVRDLCGRSHLPRLEDWFFCRGQRSKLFLSRVRWLV